MDSDTSRTDGPTCDRKLSDGIDYGRHEMISYPDLPDIDLITTALAVQAPCAEVLAVIGNQPIAILAEARVGTADGFHAREPGARALPDPDRVPMCERCERDLLHRAATQ